MVGDSEVDANSAYNACLPFVLVKMDILKKLKKKLNMMNLLMIS